jgi:hypothetical protein
LSSFFFLAIHDREADAPDAAAHEIHAEQTGHDEVDVARAALRHLRFGDGNRIFLSAGPLHDPIDHHARRSRLGPGFVEAILDAAVRLRHDHERNLARAKRRGGGRVVERRDHDAGCLLQRVHNRSIRRARHDGNARCFSGPIPKRDTKAGREHNGEDEHPEDRFRLAIELTEPCERELADRRCVARGALHAARSIRRHRADSDR